MISYWPTDLVAIVNGCYITKSDVLDYKRQRQARLLSRKLEQNEPTVKPCFVWVFYNDTQFYMGWWMYVRTIKKEWGLTRYPDSIWSNRDLILKIMRMYPCGIEPTLEGFKQWMPAFAAAHNHPTTKRPERNGLAIARAVVGPGGQLMDVLPYIREEA